ncbi:MAG: MerR family transcriptional regulator [Acidimicrobiaceae bacterium]|nr:MerR family transcriptional regulator [Acidimicrobiaceae bacterium]
MKATPSYFSIGMLVKLLEVDFPDVSISKVRFLESKGLVEPERTSSGYRRYSEKDLNQLRWVLSLQRDHFLPLRVIKERLVGDGDSEEATTLQLPQLDPSIPPDESLEFTKAELLKRTGLSEDKFKELVSYGILPKVNQSLGEMYNADDLFVAQIVSRFYSYGIEPRHLRHIKRGADAEALLIDQRLTGLQGKRATKAVVELAKLSSELKTLLLRRALHGNTKIS